MTYGTVRVRNTWNSNGGKDACNPDPLGAEIEFDGQNHFVGPNDKVVLPTSGHAAASVAANIRPDDASVISPYRFSGDANT